MEKKACWSRCSGMGAAVFYLMALTSKESALRGAYETAKVLVARLDIPDRTVIKDDQVEVLDIPRKFIQQDAVEIKTQDDMKMLLDKVTRIRVPKGNQLTFSALMAMSPESGLSVKIPPGYRGAILPIDQEMKVLIKPGDRVDVLVTFDAMMNDGRKAVTARSQNVLVIAVGTNSGRAQPGNSRLWGQGRQDGRLLGEGLRQPGAQSQRGAVPGSGR